MLVRRLVKTNIFAVQRFEVGKASLCLSRSSSPVNLTKTNILQKSQSINRMSTTNMTVKDPSGMLLPAFFMSKKEKTFEHDGSRPPLPIPPLEQTLRKYLESVKPFLTPEEMAQTRSVVEKFAENEGKELHLMLMERAKYMKNWLETWWEDYGYMYNREPHNPYVNFTGPAPYCITCWPPDESQMLSRAGLVMWCGTKYWEMLRREQLVVDRGGMKEKNIWSMDQFRRMFNSCKLPGEHKDTFTFNFKTESEGQCASHVIVMRHGRIFTFDAVDSRGEVITAPEFEVQLKRIMEICEGQPHGPGIGSLTGHNRTQWYKAREHLIELDQQNKKHLELIETSIYCLGLDDATPSTMTELSQLGLMGDCKNRWYDKNMCHVVFKNGLFTCNCDHAAHDAMIMVSATLWNYLIIQMNQLEWQGTKSVRELPPPEELEFRVDSKIHTYIDEAVELQKEASKRIEIFNGFYSKYGRKQIRKFKVHPDAFVQIAGQYAYFRLYGRPASTYETGSTRKFYHARTDTVRSCTMEALEFSRSMREGKKSKPELYRLMQAAFNRHTELIAEAQDGMEIYNVFRGIGKPYVKSLDSWSDLSAIDRHLLGMQLIAVESGKPVPEIFNDPAFKKSGGGGNFTMSTSFVGYTDVFGGVAPMCPNGYGYFYSIQDDKITYFLSTWTEDAETNAKMFFDCVCDCLDDMMELLQANAASEGKHPANL